MIQYINVLTRDGKSLLFRNYGEVDVDRDLLAGFLSAFSGFMKEISQSDIKSTATEDFKYYYTIIGSIIIVACTDLTDEDTLVNTKINTIKSKFVEKYGKSIENGSWGGNRSLFTDFEKELDNIILGAIKISILGFGGVGKTSLLHLICGKDVNLEYVPTITADIATYNAEGELGTKREIVLWDFAGQKQFRNLWRSLLEGTDIALLVSDSTFENINSTKDIIRDILNKYYKDTKIIGIANKQDLPNRLTPEFCEKILSDGMDRKIKVYGMIAVNMNYREKILALLRDTIEQIEKKK